MDWEPITMPLNELGGGSGALVARIRSKGESIVQKKQPIHGKKTSRSTLEAKVKTAASVEE